jgi:small-conductance mechanosensitive channel
MLSFPKKTSVLPAPAIHARFGQATNVKGEVLIAIYETHTEAAIQLPFPQYEARLKTGPRPEVQADLLPPARGAARPARGVGPAGG